MAFLVLAALLGLIPAFIAQSKGRSFGLWWLYGFLIFIVAIIHALVLKPTPEAVEQQAHEDGRRRCDACAELIREEATICRFCGTAQGQRV